MPLNRLSSVYFATLRSFKTKIPPIVEREEGREERRGWLSRMGAVLMAGGQRARRGGQREGVEDGASEGGWTVPTGGGRAADQVRAPTRERSAVPLMGGGGRGGEEQASARRRWQPGVLAAPSAFHTSSPPPSSAPSSSLPLARRPFFPPSPPVTAFRRPARPILLPPSSLPRPPPPVVTVGRLRRRPAGSPDALLPLSLSLHSYILGTKISKVVFHSVGNILSGILSGALY